MNKMKWNSIKNTKKIIFRKNLSQDVVQTRVIFRAAARMGMRPQISLMRTLLLIPLTSWPTWIKSFITMIWINVKRGQILILSARLKLSQKRNKIN